MRLCTTATAVMTGVLVIGSTVLASSPAFATTVNVSTFNDLQNAFTAAAAGETTTITLGADVTTSDLLNGHLTVPDNGGSDGAEIILDLNGHHLTIPANVPQYAGIAVYQGATLVIEDTSGGGVLDVTAGDYAAGIGVSYTQSEDGNLSSYGHGGGTVIINSGTVNATGGALGAGIGGAYYVGGGVITINGGTVTATAGSEATGIGNGYYQDNVYGGGASTTISITGGTVTAFGGDGEYSGDGAGAGIGLATGSDASILVPAIAISGCANVTATGGTGISEGGGAAIGAGQGNSAAPVVTIDGVVQGDAPSTAGGGASFEFSPGGVASAITYSGSAANLLTVTATVSSTPTEGGTFTLNCSLAAPSETPTTAPTPTTTTSALAATGVDASGLTGIAGLSVVLALLGLVALKSTRRRNS
jgi:hypothetical protein